MLSHDPQATPLRGWHLDKRVNVTHIFATLGFAFGLAAWMYALSDRVTINHQDIEKHEELVALEFTGVQAQLSASRERDKELMLQLNMNYKEIIRKLERIEDGVNRHIEASGQGHINGNG